LPSLATLICCVLDAAFWLEWPSGINQFNRI
jgi:hypothetical protein